MVYTVYIDVVFAVNTIMDMVILTILNRVLAYKTTRSRLAAGAVLGGIWSCVAVLCPGIPAVIRGIGTYVGVSSLMAVTAYRVRTLKDVIKSVAGIYLISVVMGGMLLVLYENTRTGYYLQLLFETGGLAGLPPVFWLLLVIGAAAACYGFAGGIRYLVNNMAQRKDLCCVTLKYKEQEQQVTGLIDTGNRLREPVKGQPVHVADEALMRELCPRVKGVVYVPFQSVGGQGTLPAVYIDKMTVKQGEQQYCLLKPLIAISRQPLSSSGEYRILIQKTDEGT